MKKVFESCILVYALLLLFIFIACKTEETQVPEYVGTWFGSNQPFGDSNYFDVKIALNTDGTYETLIYDAGGNTLQKGSTRGTYTCSNNIIHSQSTQQYDGSNWVPSSDTLDVPYSVSGNTLTVQVDITDDGIPDVVWVLTRQ